LGKLLKPSRKQTGEKDAGGLVEKKKEDRGAAAKKGLLKGGQEALQNRMSPQKPVGGESKKEDGGVVEWLGSEVLIAEHLQMMNGISNWGGGWTGQEDARGME